MSSDKLYFACFILALAISLVATPIMRWVAMSLGILDHPLSDVKTHKRPTPYLGGLGVAAAMAAALTFARFSSNFPTGTLRSVRGLLMGGALVLILGLADDIKTQGLGYRFKFWVQIAAALCLISFDIRIHFIQPAWLGNALTIVWVVGIINAVNIIDIMDGLSSGIAIVASLGFFFISLPSEQIYVNFAAAALAGALLGFIPYNLSRRYKIFLGDTGSLFTGFMLAALSMGTSYTHVNHAGVFAPILILGIPIYDTILVFFLRLQKGMSPFLGSHDHYALRLERNGLYREEILVLSYAVSLLLTFAAYEVTLVVFEYAMIIYAVVGVIALALATWLARIRID
jgi:UDP-GlcNAc:undecaprenyl-phosphate/decaprenyl-phosphate GlcNAc-1-phosphate transferase